MSTIIAEYGVDINFIDTSWGNKVLDLGSCTLQGAPSNQLAVIHYQVCRALALDTEAVLFT